MVVSVSGFDPDIVARTYSAIADDYAQTYAGHLHRLQLDRELLDGVARRVPPGGQVLDVGCGPGHIGHYLAERGCAVVGVDAAPGMLAVARRRYPMLQPLAGDMRALPLGDDSCAGLVSFYLLHHVPRAELDLVLREFRRVLAGAGQLLVATHAGTGEFSAAGVDGTEITGTLYTDEEISRALTAAGFEVDSVRHRDPLPHERQADRIYATATA